MLSAEVRSLEACNHPIDWSEFIEYESPDPYDDFGWFRISVGATEVVGTNDFHVCVSTVRAIGRARRSGSSPGIIVDQFDAQSVSDAVHARVSGIQAHSWDQIVDELRTFAHWEYERDS